MALPGTAALVLRRSQLRQDSKHDLDLNTIGVVCCNGRVGGCM